MAMASSSGRELEIIEEVDDGQSSIQNSGPVALDSVRVSSENTAMCRKRGPGVPWSKFLLFRFLASRFSSVLWKRSFYHSGRIQCMMEKLQGECSTKTVLESQIEASKVHWTQVDSDISYTERSRATNFEYFEQLKRRKYERVGDQMVPMQWIAEDCPDKDIPDSLFHDKSHDWGDVKVKEKLAEGGQAEIYGAEHKLYSIPLVVKVFKAGSLLQDLEKQWPPALLQPGPETSKYWSEWSERGRGLPGGILCAVLLRDEKFLGRFAFVMHRHWGDLRKLLDLQMMQSFNRGPDFPPYHVLDIMYQIANDMNYLHKADPPILHKDLKAANVLVHGSKDRPNYYGDGVIKVNVADFECSVGVVGSGFWRAPEILQQLKNKVPSSQVEFTKACDVYSYGMTCYEIVTGRVPFEDDEELLPEAWDLVLEERRPKLPSNLYYLTKEIIISCWHPDPSKRPSFENILRKLKEHPLKRIYEEYMSYLI